MGGDGFVKLGEADDTVGLHLCKAGGFEAGGCCLLWLLRVVLLLRGTK